MTRRFAGQSSAWITIALAAAFPQIATAAWPNQPTVNLPVNTSVREQILPASTSDGAGGAIIAWQDFRNGVNYDIYAQHVRSSGTIDPAWPAQALAVCTAANQQAGAEIAGDGAGGAIVTWIDTRSGNNDIYAQHVLASGVVDPAWPANGRAICAAIGNQADPAIVADATGGAFITWADSRAGNSDIYAHHVFATGIVDPAWPVDGRALCTAANEQSKPKLVADGSGGVVVVWHDLRGGVTFDIYCHHVLSTGAVDPLLPANGLAVCTAVDEQRLPVIAPDGSGGGIVAWQDNRSGNNDIYAMHLNASGVTDPAWPANGRALTTAAANQENPTVVSDAAAGAIVCWDFGFVGGDIYAQHILASGVVDASWPVNGRAVCTAANGQYFPRAVADGSSGVVVTWEDFRNTNGDVYAHHVLASGAVDPLWPANGIGVCTSANDQTTRVIVTDGAGGAIITWSDPRNNNDPDIYAQRVARFGYLGTPEAEIASVRDVPNDQGGSVKLSWNASFLDIASDINLSAYDVLRSVPPNLAVARIARGAHVVADLRNAIEPGSDDLFVTFVNSQTYYWEYLASVSALHYLSGYSYLAPTAQDSTASGAPKTAFMVVARNSAGTMYWPSRPDSGYSVDNQGPAAPEPFTAAYSAGATHLHWDANHEADLAHYRLYRGGSAGFVPSPANLVAEPPDTGYVDPGPAGGYYKLSALDIHDNESGFALVTPATTVGVPRDGLSRALQFNPPRPNPASVSTELSFTLPREMSVALAIYDVRGRCVRSLLRGIEPAGGRSVAWDLRDDQGHRVGAGLYHAALDVEGVRKVRRLITIP